jgi:hypothetical protein
MENPKTGRSLALSPRITHCHKDEGKVFAAGERNIVSRGQSPFPFFNIGNPADAGRAAAVIQ